MGDGNWRVTFRFMEQMWSLLIIKITIDERNKK